MVRLAFPVFLYSQVDLILSQAPKILSSDLPKQRLLLPPVQGATAKYQILHSDQALPTTTILLSRMIVRHSEIGTPKMVRELKETARSVTRSRAQPRTDEVSRMTATSGPMSDNKEIQAMTITSVPTRRMEIGNMTGTESVGVSIDRREDLRITGEMLTRMLTEVMHRGVLDLQEGAMRPLGIEKKVATKTLAQKIQKM